MASKNPNDKAVQIDFAAELLNMDALLPTAIDWISSNLQPGDVFDRDALTAWAVAAGFIPPPQ